MKGTDSNSRRQVQIFRKNEAPEFGFGSSSNQAGKRILNKDGTANIVRLGEPKFSLVNIYHSLIMMKWWKFITIIVFYYIFLNVFFSLLYYYFTPDELAGMIFSSEKERFREIFFFSAQSLTTVGYGRINPVGTMASTIASFEAFIGLMGFAIATGLLYGKFSRPTAKLQYSKNALIAPYSHPVHSINAPTALMFRIVNARNNQLIEVEAMILFAYNETVEGKTKRRFQQLKLEVDKINLLAMTWTIVHPINPESPLYNVKEEDMEILDAEMIINIKAIDDTYVQQIYARNSYKWQEMVWGARFEPIITLAPDGRTAIDMRKLSSYIPA